METLDYIKTVFIGKKDKLMKQYRIKELAVVGPAAETGKGKDLNMLVEFSDSPDIFEVCALEYHLTALFGKKVDLFTKESLKPGNGFTLPGNLVYIQ